MIDNVAAGRLAGRLIASYERNDNEHARRAILGAGLPGVFPDPEDEQWLRHYAEGEEAHTRVVAGGRVRNRFIDTLVGATVIEYERDLTDAALAGHGRDELVEKTSGLLRAGEPPENVRAVLSDGVVWHVYDVTSRATGPAATTTGDVELTEVDHLDLRDPRHRDAFPGFLRRHLGRRGSRRISADALATDLGLRSEPYRDRAGADLTALVREGRAAYPAAALAVDLWANFVDHLNGPARRDRDADFAAELYLTVLARLFCANVLADRALVSTEADLGRILDGALFRDEYELTNVVEHDYFWWTLQEPWRQRLLDVAADVQRDLAAYDFAHVPGGDLFGRLMAQLADAAQRQLLGQEWTPAWLARHMTTAALDALPAGASPRFVDMCCGSGAIVAEVLRAVAERHPGWGLGEIAATMTGFDIDALAVVLAKTTWVLTLADWVRTSGRSVTIPIYHADSLFASAPTTRTIPALGPTVALPVDLDGVTVHIPAWMVGPETRDLFDRAIEWAYDEARDAEDAGTVAGITDDHARRFFADAAEHAGLEPDDERQAAGADVVAALARRMGVLAIAERDGIWAFILRNVYRPGLLAGQFNGLVSNPPWLALSRLAANPYREFLRRRASAYDIAPRGGASPHTELATTYLLHAVDRFLGAGAVVACLLPGTVARGAHHQRFRDAAWLRTPRALPFALTAVWEVASDTFKIPAVVVLGRKHADVASTAPEADGDGLDAPVPRALEGAAVNPQGLTPVPWCEQHLGRGAGARTAWAFGAAAGQGTGLRTFRAAPEEGADLMPRTTVVIDVLAARGREYRVDTPGPASPQAFAVAGSKALRGASFPGAVAPDYLFDMVQSNLLLPFVVDPRLVRVALPAVLDAAHEWHLLDAADIRANGHAESARRFQRIDAALASDGTGAPLRERLDVRRKLTQQRFAPDAVFVLYGAGGGIPTAARFRLADHPRAVFDQTVYWHVAASEAEADFLVAIINSTRLHALTKRFNPEGAFGGRHLHAVPFRLAPLFDPSDAEHRRVAALAAALAEVAEAERAADPVRFALRRPIQNRRPALRARLARHPELEELEALTAAVLDTAHTADEVGEFRPPPPNVGDPTV